MYRVTKKFVSGILNGITITENTNVPFKQGITYKSCTGSDYIILTVEKI